MRRIPISAAARHPDFPRISGTAFPPVSPGDPESLDPGWDLVQLRTSPGNRTTCPRSNGIGEWFLVSAGSERPSLRWQNGSATPCRPTSAIAAATGYPLGLWSSLPFSLGGNPLPPFRCALNGHVGNGGPLQQHGVVWMEPGKDGYRTSLGFRCAQRIARRLESMPA
jgi:hypothetical protein